MKAIVSSVCALVAFLVPFMLPTADDFIVAMNFSGSARPLALLGAMVVVVLIAIALAVLTAWLCLLITSKFNTKTA